MAKKTMVVMPPPPKVEYRPEDRKYIEHFDFKKASQKSMKELLKRPFYTK
jgi:hypothetical protein